MRNRAEELRLWILTGLLLALVFASLLGIFLGSWGPPVIGVLLAAGATFTLWARARHLLTWRSVVLLWLCALVLSVVCTMGIVAISYPIADSSPGEGSRGLGRLFLDTAPLWGIALGYGATAGIWHWARGAGVA